MNYQHKQMSKIKSQGGWTFWSLVFTLAVVGFFAFVGMQLIPVYNSNSNVKNAMKVGVRDLDVRKATRSQIVKGIKRQLYLDGGSTDIDFKEDLKVVRDRSNLTIIIDYQRVVPLFANISILVDFKPGLKCSLNGGCEEAVEVKELKK